MTKAPALLRSPMTLFTLPPSHFCERARWALDHIGAEYEERRLAVGLHAPIMRRIADRTALPVLRIGAMVIEGSGHILDWAKIRGADPALEERLEAHIAVLVRLFAYSATLGEAHHRDVRDVLRDGVPTWQKRLTGMGWPILRRLMIAGLDARAERLPGLAAQLEAEFDWLDAVLGGRTYLVGNSFGRADMTAASLLSPLMRPAVIPLYSLIRFPPAADDLLRRWNERPILRWVRQMYGEHRMADWSGGET